MSSGRMADQVSFERQAVQDDGYGNPVSGPWEVVEMTDGVPLVVWADMLERTGKEKLDGGIVTPTRIATIRVRAVEVAGITEAERLRARGQIWNIRSMSPVGRDRSLVEFDVQTGVAT